MENTILTRRKNHPNPEVKQEAFSMLEIIDYQAEHQRRFEDLNREWIERHFWMEPIDVSVLQHPDRHILAPGGVILMARFGGEIAGTVALKYVGPGVYEFTKMAVEEKLRGRKIGQALAEAAIARAKSFGAKKVMLYSNTKMVAAVALYRKLGFVEVPVDGPYSRSNIKMELTLYQDSIHVRHASFADIDALATLGASTFAEAFADDNTAADLQSYLDENFSLGQIEAAFKSAGTYFLLAYDEGKLVGYSKLTTPPVPDGLDDHAMALERIYVVKANWGQQTGKTLLDASLAFAAQQGHPVVWLGVWEHNSRAISFYKKWGFEAFGSQAFKLGSDLQRDILMKRVVR
jgi:ribosomal protein S18 acetylase RimI-like enzyme